MSLEGTLELYDLYGSVIDGLLHDKGGRTCGRLFVRVFVFACMRGCVHAWLRIQTSRGRADTLIAAQWVSVHRFTLNLHRFIYSNIATPFLTSQPHFLT